MSAPPPLSAARGGRRRRAGALARAVPVALLVMGAWTASVVAAPAAGAQGPGFSSQLLPFGPPGPVYPSFDDISCSSTGNCVAVGSFDNDVNTTLPFQETETAGTWSAADGPAGTLLPAGAVTGDLSSLSCPAAGTCVAVGYDGDAAGNTHMLVATLSGGSWSAAALPDPAGATQPVLTGVSCTALTTCTAVGYATGSSAEQPLVATLAGTSWTTGLLALPTGAPFAFLNAVSCPAAGTCVAVGGAELAAGGGAQPLLETGGGTTWAASTLALLTGTSGAQLWDVSCTSTTTCESAGTAQLTAGHTQAEVAQDAGAGWALSAPALPPGTVGSGLYDISCPSATSCVAGGFDNTGSHPSPFTEVLSGGTFSPVPTGLSNHVTIEGVSCPAAVTDCQAVDSGPAVLQEVGGTWSQQINLNDTVNGPPEPELNGVSCASATSCVAVGDYSGPAANSREVVATLTGTSWAVSQPAALSDPVQLLAVSCPAAGTCEAVGDQDAATLSGGTWTQAAVPAPSTPAGDGQPVLQAVACWAPGSCEAAGYIDDSSGNQDGVAAVLSGGTWTATNLPDPTGDSGDAEINGIDCGNSGNCVAVGDYYDSSGTDHPYAETLTAGAWAPVATPAPAAASGGGALDAVSCQTVSACTAVGAWYDSGGGAHPLIDTLSPGSSSWTTLSQNLAPADSSGAGLYGVSCQIAAACTAVGYWSDNANQLSHSFTATLLSGSWSTATSLDPSGSQEGFLGGVSCLGGSGGTSCEAVGQAGPVTGLAPLVASASTGAPSITTTSLPAGTVGSTYATTLSATGGAGSDAWSVTAGTLPAGLTLNPSSGLLSGTPTAAAGGPVTFTVTDAEGATGSASLTVTVNAAPQIVNTSLPDVTYGRYNDFTLTVAGGTAPFNWTVSSGSLPQGMTLPISHTAQDSISGASLTTGTYNFTILVLDVNGAASQVALSITVNPPVSIVTSSLPAGTAGAAYSATLAATGGTGADTWSVEAGTLPAGLTLAPSTGVLQGTPTGGSTTPTFEVTDADGSTDTARLAVAVNPGPVITTTALPAATTGAAYSAAVDSSGGTAPFTWAVTAGALPAGVSLGANGGPSVTLQGTPQEPGTASFTLSATDANGAVATAALSLAVAAPPPTRGGYDLVGSDGGVFVLPEGATTGFYGSLPGLGVSVHDIVGIVPTSDDRGYFLVGSDGGVFSFGDSSFEGSLPGLGVSVHDIVGIAATPDDHGYWVVGADGTVYSFGDAPADGSAAGTGSPAVGISSTPDGGGYWVVDQDGAVTARGDATGFGDLPALGVAPAHPVVALVPTPDGQGYWLIAADGGVFSFGDATNRGSLPGLGVSVTDVVGAVPTSG